MNLQNNQSPRFQSSQDNKKKLPLIQSEVLAALLSITFLLINKYMQIKTSKTYKCKTATHNTNNYQK